MLVNCYGNRKTRGKDPWISQVLCLATGIRTPPPPPPAAACGFACLVKSSLQAGSCDWPDGCRHPQLVVALTSSPVCPVLVVALVQDGCWSSKPRIYRAGRGWRGGRRACCLPRTCIRVRSLLRTSHWPEMRHYGLAVALRWIHSISKLL